MASRRDELNAYTFARRRTVGAFLQPAGGGSDEDAPRPVRAVVPSLVAAAVAVAGFGMWGMIKPAAPKGWDDGKSIVVGKESTTRYVVLPNPDKPSERTLYPVLNMASARLVLDADSKVTFVEDKVLDAYGRHGATIGIPYAPDKLPTQAQAAEAKVWTVCDRPGDDANHTTVNQAVFVLDPAHAAALRNPGLVLSKGNAAYVQEPGPDGQGGDEYLVDAAGVKHSLGRPDARNQGTLTLRTGLFGPQAAPQRVTQQWLDTLTTGSPVVFPRIRDYGRRSAVRLANQADSVVGRLMSFDSNNDGHPEAHYVVGADRLYQLDDFQLQLFQSNPAIQQLYGGRPVPGQLSATEHARWSGPVGNEYRLQSPADWPRSRPNVAVNSTDPDGGTRSVLCSTYSGTDEKGAPRRSVWASTDFPAPVTNGTASAHVTPGTGLLYRAVEGTPGTGGAGADVSGSVFLLTEAGLRYRVVANGDSTAKSSVLPHGGQSPDPAAQGQTPGQAQQGNDAQARLGYKDVVPSMVPRAWSDLVPAGPNLDTRSALQPQTS
ncbi:type VII secretion protein EccB [Streptacidiphilus sp. ASG 303]|uniref:type VII secretion protein EccB n=1 Tax=Streptacidiphilus sp. ASG 303 TaxID=2896847 RepID=UPI001E43BF08|nr:type VII secretion protein EccB [Streptacidiphilus sp. ASG 303]MCD0486184.1 type VII secretion protein EccB [Streptacidiphilus sp. ASG 303]